MTPRTGDGDMQLAHALKDLDDHWAITADEWRDKARADFDKEHLEEMRMSVRSAQRAITAVNAMLRQVIQECG